MIILKYIRFEMLCGLRNNILGTYELKHGIYIILGYINYVLIRYWAVNILAYDSIIIIGMLFNSLY